jgi:DNA polymerase
MIHLDFETRSVCNLLTDGTYNYAADPTTDVNCVGWAVGDDDPEIWFPRLEPFPEKLWTAVKAGMIIAAWNAQFERLIWNYVLVRYGAPTLPVNRFLCVAALARSRGFPGKLEKAARFAGIPAQKDMDGHALMMKLCRPRRIEEDGTIVWWDYWEDHKRQGEYCLQDVRVERAMFDMLVKFTDQELSDYWLSEEINDRGILVDLELAEAAVTGAASEKLTSDDAIKAFTDGDVTACTQVAKILAWVEKEWKPMLSLNKSDVLDALQEDDIPPHVADVLELRLENAKAAVSKFAAMLNKSDTEGTVRGLFVFHGAGPGRFTSYGLQVQNLMAESNLEAIPVLKKYGIKGLTMMGEPVKILSQMVRPAFIAAPGKTFLIGDYAQVEARNVAWLAGEEKQLALFRQGISPYAAFGTKVLGKPVSKHGTPTEYKVFKACILGLGFGGAEGALARSMKKEQIVLTSQQQTEYVQAYRSEFTKIKAYWYRLRDATLLAMFSKGNIIEIGPIGYLYDGEHLWCRLPSGRLICYPFARVVQDEYGDCIEYRRGNRSPKSGVQEWPVVRLWYGMLMENLAQAIAFDLLMGALRRLQTWAVRMHVHDEIVPEVDKAVADELLEQFLKIMAEGEWWSEGLPIEAEGKTSDRYIK